MIPIYAFGGVLLSAYCGYLRLCRVLELFDLWQLQRSETTDKARGRSNEPLPPDAMQFSCGLNCLADARARAEALATSKQVRSEICPRVRRKAGSVILPEPGSKSFPAEPK